MDCWALGILVYEMLSGYSPFADHAEGNQVTIYRNIVAGRYAFPSSLSDNVAKDLVRRLLVANASKVCVWCRLHALHAVLVCWLFGMRRAFLLCAVCCVLYHVHGMCA